MLGLHKKHFNQLRADQKCIRTITSQLALCINFQETKPIKFSLYGHILTQLNQEFDVDYVDSKGKLYKYYFKV